MAKLWKAIYNWPRLYTVLSWCSTFEGHVCILQTSTTSEKISPQNVFFSPSSMQRDLGNKCPCYWFKCDFRTSQPFKSRLGKIHKTIESNDIEGMFVHTTVFALASPHIHLVADLTLNWRVVSSIFCLQRWFFLNTCCAYGLTEQF